MNNEQISTVADKARGLASEPDIDFEVCVLLKDCALTIKELQLRLESLEKEMQEQCRIIGMGAERELSLIAKVESLEKDAVQMRGALKDIASGDVMRVHTFGSFATEQPEAATADDMMNRAASTLFFIDPAIQSQGGTND